MGVGFPHGCDVAVLQQAAERSSRRDRILPGHPHHKHIPGSENLVNSPPTPQGYFPSFTPPPPSQLNMGGKDDLHWICLISGNPQHAMWLQSSSGGRLIGQPFGSLENSGTPERRGGPHSPGRSKARRLESQGIVRKT